MLDLQKFERFTQSYQGKQKVLGTAFSRSSDTLVKLDLTDYTKLEEFIVLNSPSIVIHCAAERRPDVAAKDEEGTLRLNVEATKKLGELSTKYSFYLVYISTDYVFDGTEPPYEPSDKPNPLNFYGKSKYHGELALQEYPNTLILRVPILYGRVTDNSESAVNLLIDVIKGQKAGLMDHFQSRFPTNVSDVALALNKIVDKKLRNEIITGIHHFSAKERMTKYDMCRIFGDILNIPISHLTPITEAPKDPIATRPNDCQLSTLKLESLGVSIDCVSFRVWFTEYLKNP